VALATPLGFTTSSIKTVLASGKNLHLSKTLTTATTAGGGTLT
jgi:hypothetical protein